VGGGEKYLLLAARALKDAHPEHSVELLSPIPVDRNRYESMLNVDLAGLGLSATVRRVTPFHRWANRLGPLRGLRNRVLARQAGRATGGYDLFVAMAYVIPVRSQAANGAILCQFPYPLTSPAELADFQLVVAQSEYVRRWVGRLWEREALVVNPPVDVPEKEPDWTAKEQLVVSVGRFFAGGHTKRQDVLVEAFRTLCDGGVTGWELHLAGGVHRDAQHAGYYERVAERAQGYPIVLHPDAGYAEVQDLYRRASLYWHAAGYGADPERDPDALEHFGMTTAEAMAHGAVPVVFGAAGPAEVVEDGEQGYLWRELDALRGRSLELLADAELRQRLGTAARRRSLDFARPLFMRRIVEALQPLLS
jgi:glycosyltransferase involved in cell wall biosynthesis